MLTNSTAVPYWDILYRLVPILLVGGVVSVGTNFSDIIIHEKSIYKRIMQFVPTFLVGCTAAGISVLGLSLFVTRPTPELELLSAAVAGIGGRKVIDIYVYRLFGNYARGVQCPECKKDDDQADVTEPVKKDSKNDI